MSLTGRAPTFSGVAVVGELSHRGRVGSLLVDGLGRAFNTDINRRVGCASLDDRGWGGGDRCDEEGEGGQSRE